MSARASGEARTPLAALQQNSLLLSSRALRSKSEAASALANDQEDAALRTDDAEFPGNECNSSETQHTQKGKSIPRD
eukprot:2880119-Pleurochrysis_carterae.AAC.1